MIRKKTTEREPLWLKGIRIFTGLVFVFSSTVKGIDPMGTVYRVEDYLLVYGWTSLMDYALALGVFLIIVEFLIGVALIFKLKSSLATLGLLLIMVIFTVVTYLDARYNMVPDCGCFGDAVKLTNWQTFYKNIFLIVLAVLIFSYRKRLKMNIPSALQWIILVVFIGGYSWFVITNCRHLPMVDFRDWKVGNDMKSEGLDQVKTYVKYKNNQTGEEQEFLSPDYPWSDSTWMSQWTFVDQRIDDSQRVLKHHVLLEDAEGNDLTAEIFENPGYQLVLISNDLDAASTLGLTKASAIEFEASKLDVAMVLVSSSSFEKMDEIKKDYHLNMESMVADETELKAMIRSNPGLMLLHNGIVIKKWHYHDFPEKDELVTILTP
ncbi:MAG: DoxX family protein [Bacteroidales bacterium]|nr:DoxX family protein [Bacteroidales bacterium]